MALESTAPSLEAVFTSEVRAAMAERDERIRQQERDRILAILDDSTTVGGINRYSLREVKRRIGGAA